MRGSWQADELEGPGRRVVVRGDIDLDVAEAFHDDVARWLDGGPVAVDLTDVTFMDSAGLRSLMRLHLVHGPAMQVGRVSDTVARLFEMAGVAALLGLHGGRDGGDGGQTDG